LKSEDGIVGAGIAWKWEIWQQTLLDLVGHILLITREEEVWAYA
jgi:hypothetical protein